jgi:hypothetical protein
MRRMPERISRGERWVVLNDLQIPFEDKSVVWELVVPFVRELKPYGVVLNGDIVDNHEISDFSKDPAGCQASPRPSASRITASSTSPTAGTSCSANCW